MTTLAKLLVSLGLDSSDFDEKIKESERKTADLQNKLAMLGGGIVMGAFAAVAAGAAAMTAGLSLSLKAAMDNQDVMAQTAAVIKSTGGAAGLTAEQALEMAGALSLVTKFDEEVILGGENLLMTFTNIGKGVFPLATEAMLNMSQAMGQDLKSSAIQLGKALNDPAEGMSALQRIGVTFTDQQKRMVESMMAAGKVEQAQKVILAELEREFGGVAKAAGKTFSGQLTIAKNKLIEIGEGIGLKLLPILQALWSKYLAPLIPKIEKWADKIGDAVADMGKAFLEWIPKAIEWVKKVGKWFTDNKGVIVGVLAAMGAAVVVFVYSTIIPAMIAAITAMAPVIAVLAAVGLAAYLLYQAWDKNFLGIQDTAKVVFTWLTTNIPIAIATLKKWWDEEFLPAVQRSWNWIKDNVGPIFQSVKNWFEVTLPAAIGTLKKWWTDEFSPAIQTAWNWVKDNTEPIWKPVETWLKDNIPVAISTARTAWGDLQVKMGEVQTFINGPLKTAVEGAIKQMGEDWPKAVKAMQTSFDTELKPSLEGIWKYLNENVVPIFTTLKDIIVKVIEIAITPLVGALNQGFTWAVENVKKLIGAEPGGLNFSFSDLGNSITSFKTGPLQSVADFFNGPVKNALQSVLTKLREIKDFLDNFKLPNISIPNPGGGGDATGKAPTNTSTTGKKTGTRGAIEMQLGGSFVVPSFYGWEGFKLGNIATASAGEQVTVTPPGVVRPQGKGDAITNIYVSPHYYKGDEPTLLDELNQLSAVVRPA